jgi:type VI secretion system protein ImpM
MTTSSFPPGAAPTVFALGKFAGHPEFLRADGDTAASLDEWLNSGWQAALLRHGDAWSRGFKMGSAYGFLWRARARPGEKPGATDDRLCGVIAPSVDSIGRDYPLCVFARVPAALVARAPHAVPLAFGDFLEQAYALVTDARARPMPSDELAHHLRTLAVPSYADVGQAEAEYLQWCREARLGDAWGAVFPGVDPLDRAARVLDVLAGALAPFRGREGVETSLTLRLPLGAGGPAAAVLWIDVVRRMCRWSSAAPSAFWATDAGALLLPLGAPPPGMLRELWSADPTNETVYDVAAGEDQSPPSGLRHLAWALRDQRPDARMIELLDALVR